MSGIRSLFAALCAGFAIAACLPASLAAQTAPARNWPQRPVRFILPLGPGSGSDIGARLFAERLSTRWRKPVVVENRPGGDAIVAITAFVNAHDDHILLFAPASTFTAHPFLHDKLPYDPADLAAGRPGLQHACGTRDAVRAEAGSVAGLMALARAEPGKLNWATATGISDFLFAAFLKTARLDMAKVPYRDPVHPSTDLAEGRIEFYWGAFAIVRPQVQAGKARLIAFSNTMRLPKSRKCRRSPRPGFPSSITTASSACSARATWPMTSANASPPT